MPFILRLKIKCSRIGAWCKVENNRGMRRRKQNLKASLVSLSFQGKGTCAAVGQKLEINLWGTYWTSVLDLLLEEKAATQS